VSVRIEMEPDWREGVYAGTDRVFLQELGPAIVADERRYVPVDTGNLLEHCEPPRLGGEGGHDLIIENSADYARWVEFGHWTPAEVDGHPARQTWVPPQSFMRVAVYQERSG
jgi:hypothetical protein